MALVRCTDCGAEISRKAAACPSCGAPRKRTRGSIGCLGSSAIALVVVFLIAIAVAPDDSGTRQPLSPEPKVDPVVLAKMQLDREGFINKLIDQGVFREVDHQAGRAPVIWVAPGFYLLDYKDKEAFVKVIFAYYHDGSPSENRINKVVLRDVRSGREIGDYSVWGFDLEQ